jgi:hypothetical protein
MSITALYIDNETKERSDYMKIAVTYENGMIFQHFGHTEQFKIYETENGGEERLRSCPPTAPDTALWPEG